MHQLKNAQVLADVGAAVIVPDLCDAERTSERLSTAIIECIDPQKLSEMSEKASLLAMQNSATEVAKKLVEA